MNLEHNISLAFRKKRIDMKLLVRKAEITPFDRDSVDILRKPFGVQILPCR